MLRAQSLAARLPALDLFGPVVFRVTIRYSVQVSPVKNCRFSAFIFSGSLVISDSIFRSVGYPTIVSNVSDSWILITRNTYENVFDALDLSCLLRSRCEFSFSTVQTTNVYDPTYGCAIYDADKTVSTIGSSEILISHNVFTVHSSVRGSISTGIGNRRYVHGRI